MIEVTSNLIFYALVALCLLAGIAIMLAAMILTVMNRMIKSDQSTAERMDEFKRLKYIESFKKAPAKSGVIKDVIVLDTEHLSYVLDTGESITIKNSPHVVSVKPNGEPKRLSPPPNVGDTINYRSFGGTSIYDEKQTWISGVKYAPLFKNPL